MAPGALDRALNQLIKSGLLKGLRGVALGEFIRAAEPAEGKWSFVEILYDHLLPLGVPVLGGLPIGHGPGALTVPLGTHAVLDTSEGTLKVAPGVCDA